MGQGPESANITLLPDGNGAFTEGMGMLVDKSDLGFGKRSWRYSMLVKDGVVQKMFIEPEKEGDPLKCRTPTPCWRTSRPRPRSPTRWSCSPPGCPFCVEAKALLQDKGFDPIEIPLENKVRGRVIGAVSGKGTAPQVFINGSLIGGLDDLKAHFA